MKQLLLAGATVVGLSLGSMVAQAATITIVGGSEGRIPSGIQTNESLFLFGLTNRGPAFGIYGGNLTGDAGLYDVRVYGAEAGFNNKFETPIGTTLYTHQGGTVFSSNLSSPLSTFTIPSLEFLFRSPLGTVANGLNTSNSTVGVVNFFASFEPTNSSVARTGRTVYLFLDDAGAGDDDNHDDLVVSITAVPEPGTLALFGAGLLGLGAAVRGRRKV